MDISIAALRNMEATKLISKGQKAILVLPIASSLISLLDENNWTSRSLALEADAKGDLKAVAFIP